MKSVYSGVSSRFSLSTARLMMWKRTSRSRTVAASSNHRDVIQGQAGSTQRSTCWLMVLLVLGVCTQHGNNRIGDTNRHGQVEKLVNRVRVGLRSHDAGRDELYVGIALAQRGEEGDRSTLTGETGRAAKGVVRRDVERFGEPRRQGGRVPATADIPVLQRDPSRGRYVGRQHRNQGVARALGVNTGRQTK